MFLVSLTWNPPKRFVGGGIIDVLGLVKAASTFKYCCKQSRSESPSVFDVFVLGFGSGLALKETI